MTKQSADSHCYNSMSSKNKTSFEGSARRMTRHPKSGSQKVMITEVVFGILQFCLDCMIFVVLGCFEQAGFLINGGGGGEQTLAALYEFWCTELFVIFIRRTRVVNLRYTGNRHGSFSF